MAPIVDNITDKYFVDYQTAVRSHSFLVRAIKDSPAQTVANSIAAVLTAMAPLLTQRTITAVRLQSAGTNYSFPLSLDLVGDVYGTGTATPEQDATAATFLGRDAGGRRVKFATFGYKGAISQYRLTSSESADVSNVVAALTSGTISFVTVLGLDPSWYSYADIKVNDYWVRRIR